MRFQDFTDLAPSTPVLYSTQSSRSKYSITLKRSTLLMGCLIVLMMGVLNSTETTAKTNTIPGLTHPAWVDDHDNRRLKLLTQSDHDLFFLLGYYHAKDRFFQMDVNRKRVLGQLAELFGESALSEDYRNRLLNIEAASLRSWKRLDQRTQDYLQAYASGVNTYLAKGALPSDYGTLNLTRANPWRAIDSIAIMKGVIIELSLRLDLDRTEKLQSYQAAGKQENFDGLALYFNDTHPVKPISGQNTYQSAGLSAAYSRVFSTSYFHQHNQQSPSNFSEKSASSAKEKRQERLKFDLEISGLTQLKAQLSESTFWHTLITQDEKPQIGSNWWAVTGEKSVTGKPILANDPHLSTTWPSLFYPVHLRVTQDQTNGPLNAAGGSFPGVPAIAHGQNKDLVWLSTNNPMDVSDIFLDTLVTDHTSCTAKSGWCIHTEGQYFPVIIEPQEYKLNLSTPNHLNRVERIDPPAEYATLATVPYRTFGPILRIQKKPATNKPGQALVLQYTALAGTREIQAFIKWLRVKNLTEFRSALKDFEVGSQNWLIADKNGQLAYFASAKVPLRKDLQAGQPIGFGPAFIRPGNGEANWLTQDDKTQGMINYAYLPADEMPHIINPPSDLLINANNDPTGQTLDGNLFNQSRIISASGQRSEQESKQGSRGIFYLNHDYADGLRAQRIADRIQSALAKKEKLNHLDLKKIQTDTFAQDAKYLLPHLYLGFDNLCQATNNTDKNNRHEDFQALCTNKFLTTAINTLREWDLNMTSGIDLNRNHIANERSNSLAALYYHLWRSLLIQDFIKVPVEEKKLTPPAGNYAIRALIHFLNHDSFSCQGKSGLDFCPKITKKYMHDDQRRDFVLLKSLSNIEALLDSQPFTAHLSKLQLADWSWGALHRQQMVYPRDAKHFSIPNKFLLSQFDSWGGYPISGGYEVVNATGISADALYPESLISTHGPARRTLARVKRSFFGSELNSTAIVPSGRQENWQPEAMIQEWIDNKQQRVMAKETFMRLRWQKLLPQIEN